MEKRRQNMEEQFIYMAKESVVKGQVKIGQGTSIWYHATVRGDKAPIEIGEYTNVQDNAVLHVDAENPVVIGDYVTIGHGAIIHGCTIGDESLIGMGAVILNGAKNWKTLRGRSGGFDHTEYGSAGRKPDLWKPRENSKSSDRRRESIQSEKCDGVCKRGKRRT